MLYDSRQIMKPHSTQISTLFLYAKGTVLKRRQRFRVAIKYEIREGVFPLCFLIKYALLIDIIARNSQG